MIQYQNHRLSSILLLCIFIGLTWAVPNFTGLDLNKEDRDALLHRIPERPITPKQVYRWYPRSTKDPSSKDWQWNHFPHYTQMRTTINTAFDQYSADATCLIPMEPKYTGYEATFAFKPHGYHVSKIITCSKQFSIRVANYKSWFNKLPSDGDGIVRINCHAVLQIALELVRAMEVDANFLKQAEARGRVEEDWHRVVQFSGVHCTPEWRYELAGGYSLLGSSWWGEDYTWQVHLGVEREYGGGETGCPSRDGREKGESEWCQVV